MTPYQNNVYNNFLKTDISDYDHIYVDRWESPSVRYLMEYGIFSTNMNDSYPDKFTFGKFMPHSEYMQQFKGDGYKALNEFYKIQPKMNDYSNYDLMITPELYVYSKVQNDNWMLLSGTTNFYIKK